MNKLVQSNRNRQKINNALKPQKTAKASDFNKKSKNKKTNISSITYNTNLKINNHERNKLEAIASLGFAQSQKDALNIATDTYISSLPKNQREEINLLIKTFEHRDIIKKNKK